MDKKFSYPNPFPDFTKYFKFHGADIKVIIPLFVQEIADYLSMRRRRKKTKKIFPEINIADDFPIAQWGG